MHIEIITLQTETGSVYGDVGIEEETGHCTNQNYYVTITLNVEK